MNLTDKELWTLIHGMGLGAVFLLAFGGGLAGLWSLRPKLVTEDGIAERTPRLLIGTTVMALVAWLTVIVGTWIVYPWYRATPPEGLDLTVQSDALRDFPRYWLLASEETAEWHEFGMEWKEHVAWLAPFLATAVAVAVIYYGAQLIRRGEIRRAMLIFFTLAFAARRCGGPLRRAHHQGRSDRLRSSTMQATEAPTASGSAPRAKPNGPVAASFWRLGSARWRWASSSSCNEVSTDISSFLKFDANFGLGSGVGPLSGKAALVDPGLPGLLAGPRAACGAARRSSSDAC